MGFLGAFTGRQEIKECEKTNKHKAGSFEVNDILNIVILKGLNVGSKSAPTSSKYTC